MELFAGSAEGVELAVEGSTAFAWPEPGPDGVAPASVVVLEPFAEPAGGAELSVVGCDVWPSLPAAGGVSPAGVAVEAFVPASGVGLDGSDAVLDESGVEVGCEDSVVGGGPLAIAPSTPKAFVGVAAATESEASTASIRSIARVRRLTMPADS